MIASLGRELRAQNNQTRPEVWSLVEWMDLIGKSSGFSTRQFSVVKYFHRLSMTTCQFSEGSPLQIHMDPMDQQKAMPMLKSLQGSVTERLSKHLFGHGSKLRTPVNIPIPTKID